MEALDEIVKLFFKTFKFLDNMEKSSENGNIPFVIEKEEDKPIFHMYFELPYGKGDESKKLLKYMYCKFLYEMVQNSEYHANQKCDKDDYFIKMSWTLLVIGGFHSKYYYNEQNLHNSISCFSRIIRYFTKRSIRYENGMIKAMFSIDMYHMDELYKIMMRLLVPFYKKINCIEDNIFLNKRLFIIYSLQTEKSIHSLKKTKKNKKGKYYQDEMMQLKQALQELGKYCKQIKSESEGLYSIYTRCGKIRDSIFDLTKLPLPYFLLNRPLFYLYEKVCKRKEENDADSLIREIKVYHSSYPIEKPYDTLSVVDKLDLNKFILLNRIRDADEKVKNENVKEVYIEKLFENIDIDILYKEYTEGKAIARLIQSIKP